MTLARVWTEAEGADLRCPHLTCQDASPQLAVMCRARASHPEVDPDWAELGTRAPVTSSYYAYWRLRGGPRYRSRTKRELPVKRRPIPYSFLIIPELFCCVLSESESGDCEVFEIFWGLKPDSLLSSCHYSVPWLIALRS